MSTRNNPLLNNLGASAFASLERYFLRKKSAEDAERAGEKLGRMLYHLPVLKKQRTRALSNLAMAFPEWPEEKRVETAKAVFVHLGRVAGDFLRSTKRTKEETLRAATVEGFEHVEAAIAMDKGVIAITAHFGNWDRCAHWFACTFEKVTVVARDANDEGLQQHVSRIRAQAGVEVVSRGRLTRVLIESLRAKEFVGLMPDQNSSESFVPFFGKPAGTVLGPSKLQKMTGAPILPTWCVRVGPAKYRLIFRPPILPAEGETVEDIMARVNAELEAVVREYPEQWLWIHDRWKSARQGGLL